jgi:glyoxylase-like metal-dependent hydrolase (beta-lactamase superfamily II)
LTSIEKLLSFIQKEFLNVHLILETHAHADHISGSQMLKEKLKGAHIGISKGITEVQTVFKNFFNFDFSFKTDGSQFDLLMDESKPINAGTIKVETLFTPGHTPACACYVIGEIVFVGDVLFMPDSGTGRCDFPSGSATELYHSIYEKLYKLPEHYKVFVGHDYLPNGRALAFETSIGVQKQKNIHINIETKLEQFVEFRNARDKTLTVPRLLYPSIQINITAGNLPAPENNGNRYLKIPIA